MAKNSTKTETTKPAKPAKPTRTPEKRRADILRMVAAAAAARSAKKVPSTTIRLPVLLLEHLQSLNVGGEPLWQTLDRAVGGVCKKAGLYK